MLENTLLILFAYLLGSVSSAIITCKLFGLSDPRTSGSLNPGATNVMRLGGKLPAIITLLGDSLKGVIPVALAVYLGNSKLIAAICMLGAFLGHLYPLFFKFKGGKGVATAIGGLFIVSWLAGLGFGLVWLITFGLTRISSISALLGTLLMPIFIYFTVGKITTIPVGIIAILIFYKHKSNISRLIKKEEKKL